MPLNPNPSYGTGFARSKAESAFPEMWRGLVAAYPFFLGSTGGVVRDQASRQKHGTWNGTGIHWTGGSSILNGADDFVNIDDILPLLSSTTTGTISVRMRPVDATPATNLTVIGFGDTDQVTLLAIILDETGDITINCTITGFAQARWILDTDNVVAGDNAWIEITLVQDGVSPIVYIDGAKVPQSFSISNDTSFWLADLPGIDNARIGALNFNSAGDITFTNGNISHVYFWDRALAGNEVAALHQNPKKPFIREPRTTFFVPTLPIHNRKRFAVGDRL